ncbi:MAG: BlaI/MecI/CopY family transcriptional regulator, partial [Porphyromonas sp.]|nr:BlaI/MecI/CopY family transcriptional regulator [Porphyromonas sp.]
MSKTKILPLTPQEESVMKMIWELGNGITVRQVLEKLP